MGRGIFDVQGILVCHQFKTLTYVFYFYFFSLFKQLGYQNEQNGKKEQYKNMTICHFATIYGDDSTSSTWWRHNQSVGDDFQIYSQCLICPHAKRKIAKERE